MGFEYYWKNVVFVYNVGQIVWMLIGIDLCFLDLFYFGLMCVYLVVQVDECLVE